MQPSEYLHLLAHSSAAILDEARSLAYPASLAAAVSIASEQLLAEDPAAAQLLTLLAMLGPDRIPTRWFRNLDDKVTVEPFAPISQVPLKFRRALRNICSYGLARIDAMADAVTVHRLTQLIIRNQLGHGSKKVALVAAHIVSRSAPSSREDPSSWPSWVELVAHLSEALAQVDGERISGATFSATSKASLFLLHKGEFERAAKLMSILGATSDFGHPELNNIFREAMTEQSAALSALFQANGTAVIDALNEIHVQLERAGETDSDKALTVGESLAFLYSLTGRHAESRDMQIKMLERCHRRHGAKHPDTLLIAANLGYNLLHLGDRKLADSVASKYGAAPNTTFVVADPQEARDAPRYLEPDQ
jgi:hypothetical protein